MFISPAQFQSTRPRGARLAESGSVTGLLSFNPRARGGRDLKEIDFFLHNLLVSIHAPAGGATESMATRGTTLLFQSTRPRGARPLSFQAYNCLDNVSIHAPAGGATKKVKEKKVKLKVSIHAPAGGATHSADIRDIQEVSIHAPAGGATLCNGISCRGRMFQSTRPRGARHARSR